MKHRMTLDLDIEQAVARMMARMDRSVRTYGKHRAAAHLRVPGPVWPGYDAPVQSECRGGIKTREGKRLTTCKSQRCPVHQPEQYAADYATHKSGAAR